MRIHNIMRILLLLVLLICISSAGYMLLGDLSFIDSLYMTVITISTVGYAEVAPMDGITKIFTILIILGGLGIVAYSFTTIAAFVVEGDFRRIMKKRSMERRIGSMKDHYIVCGAGQTGASVIEQFRKSKVPFVVVELNKEKCDELMEDGCNVVTGDATNEDVLHEVNISEAKGLIACLETDSDNVFAVLTARGLNRDLHIVARSIDKNAPNKLKKAGADQTISPNEIGGTRMAFLMLRPNVVNFLESITRLDDQVLDIGEVTIGKSSQLNGTLLKDARIPEKTGLIVIAIKKKSDASMKFNPSSETRLDEETTMLVLGKIEKISKLKKIAGETENPGV